MTWTTQLIPTADDTDYLGHVTAYVHLRLLEQARAEWLAKVQDDPTPGFVLAHQELNYRREILLSDSPVTVRITPVRVGRSSVVVQESIVSAADTLHTQSTAVLVRWDRNERRPIPFPPDERESLTRLVGGQT